MLKQLSSSPANAHPIIGIVVFVMLMFQPLLGFIHHRQFKRYQRRKIASHLHLWDGRIAIVLGIVNGGLGLRLAGARETLELAYTIVAAIMGGAWVILALISECRRGRKKVDTSRGEEAKTVKVIRVQKPARHGSSDGESERSRH
jgi:sulfite exporter TauE/SafE